MKITSFFIDRFKEISIPTPSGIQEDGGVYGDETNFSTWTLGQEAGTSDFVGIVKTNILYGELFKITLDTGNLFNTAFVPQLNEFMNMDLQTYWENIVDGAFTFNDIKYDDYRGTLKSMGVAPGGGRPGGGTFIPYPTLLEYAMGVKERIGWVEVNRSRASIYYTICYDGKRARSDNFYDFNKFIMTPELFNVDENLFVSPNVNFKPLSTFLYENINPYGGEDERFYTVSPTPPSTLGRVGLQPIDTWFTWTNNAQGHFKTYKAAPGNIPNNVIGGLDTFPWPRGPMWGQYRGTPKDYLQRLITGNQTVLDANINDGPVETKLQVPSGIGSIAQNIPLLIANNQVHLNAPMGDRLVNIDSFGTPTPISPVYSLDIWGERRNPVGASTIGIGFLSQVDSPSYGVCQFVDGIGDTDGSDGTNVDISLRDPFGLDLYNLDKEYNELYKKFKFCPPRKKVKYDLNTKPVETQKPNPGQITKVTTGNTEEYNLPDNTVIIKTGPFNPDKILSFDNDKIVNFDPSEPGYDITYQGLDTGISYYTEDAETDNGDGIYDTPAFIGGTLVSKDFFQEPDYSVIKNTFRLDTQMLIHNQFEIDYGIRRENDLLLTNTEIPYGTYTVNTEKTISSGSRPTIKKTIKISQTGADADIREFKRAVSDVVSLAGNEQVSKLKPLGVKSNGFPIYAKNTVEESIRDITEQLTGIKEIIFRGSEVQYGAVSYPMWRTDPVSGTSSEWFEFPKKFEYINTGISVSGSVDLSTGEKYDGANFYTHRIFTYLAGANPKNLNITDFMQLKEKNLKTGELDFIGNYTKWVPYANIKDKNEKNTLTFVTDIIVSKYDVLGNLKEFWASTPDNPKGSSIKNSSQGTIFLESKGIGGLISDTYIFNIVGSPIEFDTYYKIPVKFVSSRYNEVPGYNDNVPPLKYANFLIRYSKTVSTQKPSDQKVATTKQNTYGGWVFSGLWHRDGSWPLDHKFRSGLLGNYYWTPCDGGVNTGAWRKVHDSRVMLEYHDFQTYSRDTVYSYIHTLWLKQKDIIFNVENKPTSDGSIGLSPYTEDNPQFWLNYEPNELNSANWEDWEKILDTQRRYMLEQLKDVDDRVLIIRLRDNEADPSRGLEKLNVFTATNRDANDDATRLISRKPGHFLEEWIVANKITSDDSIMDRGDNYGMRWYPEPTEHTLGTFKKDQWYRAIFFRAVSSPSKPNGEIAQLDKDDPRYSGLSCRELFNKPKRGKYRPTENNKKAFCDTLYVAEQIFKMHRARLIEMKKYVDAKIKFGQNAKNDIAKFSFERSMEYVKGIRSISRRVKK